LYSKGSTLKFDTPVGSSGLAFRTIAVHARMCCSAMGETRHLTQPPPTPSTVALAGADATGQVDPSGHAVASPAAAQPGDGMRVVHTAEFAADSAATATTAVRNTADSRTDPGNQGLHETARPGGTAVYDLGHSGTADAGDDNLPGMAVYDAPSDLPFLGDAAEGFYDQDHPDADKYGSIAW